MKRILLASSLLLGLGGILPTAAADVRMFVRHDVTDYAAWRSVYDGFEADRKALGVVGAAVYQSVDNPNDVTVTHDFKTADQAKAFAASEKLKNAMKNAGVKGPPQIWFTSESSK